MRSWTQNNEISKSACYIISWRSPNGNFASFVNSGSENYNFKEFHSIILLAMCDASYNSTIVDIGTAGRCSDGGVFSNSEMVTVVQFHTMHLVMKRFQFPLLTNLMCSYPGRGKRNLPLNESIFNYRLSRGRHH